MLSKVFTSLARVYSVPRRGSRSTKSSTVTVPGGTAVDVAPRNTPASSPRDMVLASPLSAALTLTLSRSFAETEEI